MTPRLVTPEPLTLTSHGEDVLAGRVRWADRPPFDLGGTTSAAWRFDLATGEPASAT